MRSEKQMGAGASLSRQLKERVARANYHCVNEARMIEKGAQLLHTRSATADSLLGSGDVFEILSAARVAAERGGEKGERAANTVCFHLLQRIRQERRPVAVAPVKRELDSSGGEFILQSGKQCAVLSVDGTSAAEVIVMLGDFKHSLA